LKHVPKTCKQEDSRGGKPGEDSCESASLPPTAALQNRYPGCMSNACDSDHCYIRLGSAAGHRHVTPHPLTVVYHSRTPRHIKQYHSVSGAAVAPRATARLFCSSSGHEPGPVFPKASPFTNLDFFLIAAARKRFRGSCLQGIRSITWRFWSFEWRRRSVSAPVNV